jgi:hypothetical protein
MGRQGLRAALALIGGVATVAGGRGVVRGAAELRRPGPVSAPVDSEYRFYAAWYHVLGLLLLKAARRPEREAALVRACAGGFFLAACGRVLSIRAKGRPHPWQQVLMAVEFAMPAVLLPWHRAVRSAAVRSAAVRLAAPSATASLSRTRTSR